MIPADTSTTVVSPAPTRPYVGRLAPSPTGHLHIGHARTFWIAAERARAARGRLLLRIDDLDTSRCRPAYVDSALEDLAWLGLATEAPVYFQSARLPLYREALVRLHSANLIYPCHRSRRDLAEALAAPHEGNAADDEPLYPIEWRPSPEVPLPAIDTAGFAQNWRFRVPDGETLAFTDALAGPQSALAGQDFGDFLVWRKDGLPSYQLACAVDDAALGITEVVRGADLVRSTFRQLLLLRALKAPAPSFAHAPLMLDEHGERLAKRHDALALRTLREAGVTAVEVRARFALDRNAERSPNP